MTLVPLDAGPVQESVEELYDNAPCGYLTTSVDGTVLKVNQTLLRWTGWTAADVLGRRFRDLLPPGGQVYHDTHLAPMLRLQGAYAGIALDLVSGNGHRLSVLVSSNVRTDEAGEPVLVRITVVDATDRRSYERRLLRARRAAEESETRLRVLHRAAAALAGATDPVGVLDALSAAVTEEFHAAATGVWLVDAGRGALVRSGSDPSAPGDSSPAVVPLVAQLPLAEAVRCRDVVAVESPEDGGRRFPLLTAPMQQDRTHSLVAVPLTAHGAVVGVYQTVFRRSRTYAAQELELHRTLGVQCGEALERARMAEELRRQALHDPLTGAPNRALFTDRLTQALAASRRTGEPVAVLFLDLDGFKAVNDGRGHSAGDRVLVEVVQRLQRVLRADDSIGRFGGDEFAVLCRGMDLQRARQAATRVAEALRPPHGTGAHAVTATASIGIAVHDPASGEQDTAERLLRDADAAMYRAKALGKDGAAVYDESLDVEVTRRATAEAMLRRALAGDGIVLHHQPVFDLADGTVCGVETLCRLDDGAGGLVLPGEFIDVAEERGLIVPLGRRVLELACAQWAAWDAEGAAPATVSVNVAAEQAARSDFADEVLAVLSGTGCPPDRLVLELTESALLEAGPTTLEGLNRLRAAGIGISLDDFGTRYASLHYLQHLPLTALKIDRSFVAALPGSAAERAIVRCVAQLAAELGLGCTAEGIETEGQRDFLAALGVRGQGYALARPMSATDVSALLSRHARPG